MTSMEPEKITQKLFDDVMRGYWNGVAETYKQYPFVHATKITNSEDTALHIAVYNGQEDIVKKLVLELEAGETTDVLKLENDMGNTPLHLASALGSVNMCECIAKKDRELISARNRDGETPLFLAALNGNKDAFLCLHDIWRSVGGEEDYNICIRNHDGDGESILHSAIAGEYFDLALQIIHRYEKLVNHTDKYGFTPLHILASKPSAFRSGSHLGWFNKIIYFCTFVDELEVEKTVKRPDDDPRCYTYETKYPENYRTCINIFGLLMNLFRVLFNFKQKEPVDSERQVNPKQEEQVHSEREDAEGKKVLELLHAMDDPQVFPPNNTTCFEVIKVIMSVVIMLIILGIGPRVTRRVQEKKKKHTWSLHILRELLSRSSAYKYNKDNYFHHTPRQKTTEAQKSTRTTAENSSGSTQKNNQNNQYVLGYKMEISISGKEWGGCGSLMDIPDSHKNETPILIAAKNGITEMVERILVSFPVAIHDQNSEKKNIVLLAVENRQPHVYQLLLKMKNMKDIFQKLDIHGNSALHLAAMLGEYRPWLISGAAFQMQWEIKWFEFVNNSLPVEHLFARYNKTGQTPKEIFKETHKDPAKSGGEWLTNTSQSCSVVAALIATVAFATSSTVPGGVNQHSGTPTLENKPPFNVFAISSLIALCLSVTALVMFLAILTSRYQDKDFRRNLPRKLLFGLTSLFLSIASMLISFCAGHFFVISEKLKLAAFPVYAVTCLPITFFAAAQFPLYVDLIWAMIKNVPQRSYKK